MDKNIGIKTNEGKIINDKIVSSQGGEARDVEDIKKFRDGRETYNKYHPGFNIGKYIQTPPILFTRDRHAMYLGDTYRGSACFIVAGGPSFSKIDKTLLSSPGILTMGLNNSVKSFRPNLWCSVDDPKHFMKSIWLDPKIQKFTPMSHSQKNIFDNESWKQIPIRTGDCPNTLFYTRNEKFQAQQFLYEDSVNWGDHGDFGGGRSCLLASIRILFYLGIRQIYLLGVDFDMSEDNKYHFQQDRTKSSISGNNYTYNKLKQRFKILKPIFQENGLKIYNCNPDSKLKQFQFIDFQTAINNVKNKVCQNFETQPTSGLYDRQSKNKKEQKPIVKNTQTKLIGKKEQKIRLTKQDLQKIKKNIIKEDFVKIQDKIIVVNPEKQQKQNIIKSLNQLY